MGDSERTAESAGVEAAHRDVEESGLHAARRIWHGMEQASHLVRGHDDDAADFLGRYASAYGQVVTSLMGIGIGEEV